MILISLGFQEGKTTHLEICRSTHKQLLIAIYDYLLD